MLRSVPVEQVIVRENSEVSIIIPSWDGRRNGNVVRLIEQIRRQTHQNAELFLVVGEKPNGYARNLGARAARGRFLVFIDDDTILADDKVIENLIRPFSVDTRIGMTGASSTIPPHSNRFQKWVIRYMDTWSDPRVDEITDTEHGAKTQCCAFTRAVWKRLGGANPALLVGIDPDLRDRTRQAGYRVVLAPNCVIYHPMPESVTAFMAKVFSYGKGGAVYRTECKYLGLEKSFTNQVSLFIYSVLRIALSIAAAAATVVRLKPDPVRFLTGPAFWWGYYRGYSDYLLSGKYEKAKASLAAGGRGWSDV